MKNLRRHLKMITHKRVGFFLLTGVAVMFLTFLTHDNALEIAISGVASIFIGIGVNNFSSIESKSIAEIALKRKLDHSLRILQLADKKVQQMYGLQDGELHTDIHELHEFIKISMELIKEDEVL
ncbi:MAG: hypothetical protein QM802_01270 [Agriterribacter sp.]